jgi:hypothetical protein
MPSSSAAAAERRLALAPCLLHSHFPLPQLDVSRKLLALRADAARVAASGRVPLARRGEVLAGR